MLVSLHVKNLALIDEAEVYFTEGLNILTGETGAGKSILIGSINLALGDKFPKDLIRENADYALVELVFEVTKPAQIRRLNELDIYPGEDSLVVLTRKLVNKRSIGKVNGETVSAATLKKISEILIDIHGQHEHQSLLYKKKHLDILDEFGKAEIEPLKKETAEAYHAYANLLDQWESADMDEEQRTREVSFLEFEISEIEAAALKSGEDEELESAYRKMTNARKILEAVTTASGLTGSDELSGAGETIGRALRELHAVSSYDEGLQGLCDQLATVEGLLTDFHRELVSYAEELTFSPEDFAQTEERLDLINHLKSKYGQTLEEIEDYQKRQQQRLDTLRDYEQFRGRLKKEMDEAYRRLLDVCGRLSRCRNSYAKKMSKLIENALKDLNFLDVVFKIEVRELEHPTSNGRDEAEFMISTNPGESIRSLAQVASGGELSRIMLGIKTVMADQDDTETLIFDEIDTGISGRTAQKVSERLAVVASDHQVICITHLAQIAAMADTHFVIEKNVDHHETKTSIRRLKDEESVQELARILGGAQITDTILQSAKEMKELAIGAKSS